ncbi:MAG TPA: hypothetical protein VJB88_15565 [Vicinamibacteria bacterium]|nr:hypothetical protein [Vicinamibacteria bacterium]
MRNRWVLEGLRRMDYAAINIGELEVIEETDRWNELGRASNLPWVSANAGIPAGSDVQPSPYLIRELETAKGRRLRVGLLGLTAPTSDRLAIEFRDPSATAREYVAQLAGECDLLIVLAQMSLSDAQELAKLIPQIDVLIGAANDTHLAKPIMEGNTLIGYPYPQGMGLGDLRLFFDQNGRPARFFYRVVPLAAQLADHPDFVEFQREAEAEISEAKSP